MDKSRVAGVEVFSTCPFSTDKSREAHCRNVAEVARWSEDAGCKGILIYTDNSMLDPWLIAQIVIQNTDTLCPLVAVQPAYMHPYTVAKMISSFAHLYGRRIYLNMVAGGFTNDLAAFNDNTPHDLRYARLIEYTAIIKGLLSNAPTTFDGKFYKVTNLRMTPPLLRELFPGILISGSSEAGLDAVKKTGATAIMYPKPAPECGTSPRDPSILSGIRIGIIARPSESDAWQIAHTRFPPDRKGQLTHQLAMKTSDSQWHKQLSQLGEEQITKANPYWLVPFQNYKTFCPYLVGSYQRVARELARYTAIGHRTFILDIPPVREELQHIGRTFELASKEEDP